MKILLTVHQFFPDYTSGTEVLTCSVARELMVRGHEVHVLTGFPSEQALKDQDRFDEYEYEGIHVYRFHHAYTAMAGQTSLIELSYDNHLAARYFEQILALLKPDVVHFFHLNRLGTGLIELAVRAGIPAFMTPTDFWAICPTGQLVLGDGKLCSGPSAYAGNCVKHFAASSARGFSARVANWLPTVFADGLVKLTRSGVMPSYSHRIEVQAIAARLSKNVARLNQLNKIFSPNPFMTEMLLKHGVMKELIIQSAYGIDVVAEKALRLPPRQPFRIGYIGTLAPHKGCHILIEACKTLAVGAAVLKIYGNTQDFPEYAGKLKQMATHQHAVEFCGTFHNSEIAEVLADIDVLVVPSLWYENTPLVIYSAQSARCPVVASDFPGISGVIRDGENGLLFEAGNVADLAGKLSRLIAGRGLAEWLSAHSRPPKSTACYVDELLAIWSERVQGASDKKQGKP